MLQLIAAINCFESVTNVTRFLLWPVFIDGAEGTLTEHRQWALGMLDTIWRIACLANAKTAEMVLKDIWKRKDLKSQGFQFSDLASESWMVYISLMDTSWLLV